MTVSPCIVLRLAGRCILQKGWGIPCNIIFSLANKKKDYDDGEDNDDLTSREDDELALILRQFKERCSEERIIEEEGTLNSKRTLRSIGNTQIRNQANC